MVDFPQRLYLPSGRVLQMRIEGSALEPSSSCLFGEALHLFESRFRIEDERGNPVAVDSLRLCEFHTLRAIALRAHLLPESPISVECRNCEEGFEARPSQAIELGPFIDGELDCDELDAPFPFGEPQLLAKAIAGGEGMDSVTLVERTVKDIRPLWEKLASDSFEIDEVSVVAMGIRALGEERRPEVIARMLSEASDEVLGAILALFDEAHYPLRLRARVRCPRCSAIEYVDAPAEREFLLDDPSHDASLGGPFLDLDTFEAKVRAIADEVYRQRGVTQEVNLLVCADVPAVDDGGIPLLGSYVPQGVDPVTGIERSPEVTLYYRSFRVMWEEEGPYDVDAELRETIDHELEHHLHHLQGHDPLDEDERALIEDEDMRLVGRRETVRRARAGFVADIGEFWWRTWPLWVLVALLTVVATLAER